MLGQMFATDTESGAKEKGEGCSHLLLPWHRLKTMTSSSPLSLSRWISPSLYLSVSPPFELPYSSKSRLLSLKSLLRAKVICHVTQKNKKWKLSGVLRVQTGFQHHGQILMLHSLSSFCRNLNFTLFQLLSSVLKHISTHSDPPANCLSL